MESIDIYDQETPLSELRHTLGWNTTQENVENLVMVLCQRIEALEARVAQLESEENKDKEEVANDLPQQSPKPL